MESDSRKEGIRQSWSWESIDVAAMWCVVAALGTNHIQSERNPSITSNPPTLSLNDAILFKFLCLVQKQWAISFVNAPKAQLSRISREFPH